FACSSSGEPGPHGGAGDAGAPDGDVLAGDVISETAAAPDADACTEQPVWTTDSVTFTITRLGGDQLPPPAGAGCSDIMIRWDFSKEAKTLERRGCRSSGSVNRSMQLNDREVTPIVQTISAFRSSCRPGCGADGPSSEALTVRSAGVETTYIGDFKGGCSL